MNAEHTSPCQDLIEVTHIVARHTQALENGHEWQKRLDDRVNQLLIVALGSLLSTLVTVVVASAGVIVSLLRH